MHCMYNVNAYMKIDIIMGMYIHVLHAQTSIFIECSPRNDKITHEMLGGRFNTVVHEFYHEFP